MNAIVSLYDLLLRSFTLAVAVIVLFLVFLCWHEAHAQAPVQHVPSELRASQACAEARGTGAQTATLTPPAGNFVYVNSIEINAAAQAGAAASLGTPASATSTNLPGSLTFGFFPATASATAGNVLASIFYPYSGNGLKSSAPGTAVTVVAPSVTNVGWHISICGYFAP